MTNLLDWTKNWQKVLLLAAVIGMSFSCNRDYPNLLKGESNDTIRIPGREAKVLYIMVSGARGQAVKEAEKNDRLPVISEMEKHAIYTYDGMADYEKAHDTLTTENGWANMLTGVTQTKTNADEVDWGDMDFSAYPTFITRLKQIYPDWQTLAFCSSDELKTHLLSDATVSKSFSGDDEAAVQATVQALQTEDSAKIVIAQLSGVESAGKTQGYNSTAYLDAIETTDAQIGEIMDALKSREGYEGENWMVIIASGKGGGSVQKVGVTGETVYDDSLRNTFVLFYNKDFQTSFVPKPENTSGAGPYIDTAVHLYGKPNSSGEGVNVEVPTKVDQSDLNIGTGDLTVEAKVKIDESALGTGNIPFLTKDKNRGSNGAGWSLWYNGGAVNLYVDDGSVGIEYKGAAINDGKWHTVGFKAYHIGSTIHTTLYTDGQVTGTASKEMPNVVTSSPLRIGYNDNIFGNTPLAMHITDVRIWKKALSDDIIAEYACYPGFPPATHPNLSDLIGFWGVTKSTAKGDTILDLTGNGRYALINAPGGATVTWDAFSETSNNICPAPAPIYYQMVPNSVDIPFEIYQWLSVSIRSDWGLDGKAWITGYTDVTNPVE